jgi:hypothetical protein
VARVWKFLYDRANPVVVYTFVVEVVNPIRDGRSRMQPHGRIWQELTWSWAYSTGHPTSDQRLEAAAKTAGLMRFFVRGPI